MFIRSKKQGKPSVWMLTGIALAGAVALGAAGTWVGIKQHWIPEPSWDGVPLQLVAMSAFESKELFNAQAGMTQTQARELYKQSLQQLNNKQLQPAIDGFKQLLNVYPGLAETIHWHLSDAYSQLPDEGQTQTHLLLVLAHHPPEPLRLATLYKLGQSYVRSNQPGPALKLFQQLQQQSPQSPYGQGALYYLGQLNSSPAERLNAWKAYLTKNPEGRFAGELTQQLATTITQPTIDDEAMLGMGYYHSLQDWPNALTHFPRAPLHKVWLEYGQALLKSDQHDAGVKTIYEGLKLTNKPESFQTGLDTLLKDLPAEKQLGFLKALSQQPLAVGLDYVLWQLASRETSPAQQQMIYRMIVARFPKSDYAPESSWQSQLQALKENKLADFEALAKKHLTQYPHSRSAPRTLFWLGKIAELNAQKSQAVMHYQNVLDKFPNDYYALRAHGRLQTIQHGVADPAWSTAKTGATYPPKISQPDLAKVLEASKHPALLQERVRKSLVELETLGAWDDVALLTQDSEGKWTPLIESWLANKVHEPAKSIRVLREGLMPKVREGYRYTPIDLALLYPMPFPDLIAANAQQNNLNPYLVQALTREESFFNELAISSSDARGLMQLLPSTAKETANWLKLPRFDTVELFVPQTNIALGTRYLRYLHEQFQGHSMLAVGSYNGGPGAMRRWLSAIPAAKKDPDLFVEMIPYDQTREYIRKVFGSYWTYQRQAAGAEAKQ